MIKIVSFYKDINLEHEKIKKLKVRTSFDYKSCQKKLFETLKKINTSYEFIISTDNSTCLEPYTKIERNSLDNKLLMEAVAISNNNFIQKESGKIILLGADHLFCGDPKILFDEEFDIALLIVDQFDQTHCTNINNTLIVINSNKQNINSIRQFFKDRLEICLNLPLNERSWFADQKSLSLLLEKESIISNYHKNKNTFFMFKDLKIKLIPWGRKYLKIVDKLGNYKQDPDDVLIDFCGDYTIKKNLQKIYQQIIEKYDNL